MSRVLIWDWDGTLADSLPHKYEGVWKDVFPDREDLQEAVIAFIKTEEGKRCNRYGLIGRVLVDAGMLPAHIDFSQSEDVEEYAKRYKESVANAPLELMPGAKGVLEALSQKFSMYVVSGGGSDKDLETLLGKMDVAHFFQGIFGYGVEKAEGIGFGKMENYARILQIEGEVEGVCVIGDTPKDKEFAAKIHARFIGVAHTYNGWEEGEGVVATLEKIPELLA